MPERTYEASWDEVHARFADVSGAEGIRLRRRHYAPYFLRLGRDVMIEEGCRFYHPARIVLEDGARLNVGCLLYGSGGIKIGRHVLIGPRTFIHSANHQIDPRDSRAFFERGYDYDSVEIGDNSLISANVSIVPGARLSAGCFVACGAVVPGRDYAGGTYLAGVPASPMATSTAQPEDGWRDRSEIAFVVPAEGSASGHAVDHLREVLGFPQLARITDRDPVPESVHTLILLAGASPPPRARGRDIWRTVPGPTAVVGDNEGVLLSLPGGFARRLPKQRCTRLIPIAQREFPAAVRIKNFLLWLNERLCKRSDPIPHGEFQEWLSAIRLLNIVPGREDRLLEHLMENLWRRWPNGTQRPECAPAPDSCTQRDEMLAEWMLAEEQDAPCESGEERDSAHAGCRPPFSAFRNVGKDTRTDLSSSDWLWRLLEQIGLSRKQSDETRKEEIAQEAPRRRMTRKEGLASPALLIWHAVESVEDPEESAYMRALVTKVAPHCNTSLRLVAIMLSARTLGLPDIEEKARALLDSADWWPFRGCVPRLRPERDNLLLSPLLLAWWVLDDDSGPASLPDGILSEIEETQTLKWTAFGNPTVSSQQKVEVPYAVLDEEKRTISDSLLLNWTLLHRAECSGNAHYKIHPWAYGDAVEALEDVWRRLFTWLQHRRDRPILRLRPWPAPYQAALSLRYDIDRPISVARAHEVIDLQATHVNAPCGSWYFRKGDVSRPRLLKALRLRWQETGAHLEAPAEAQPGEGATHHSAPTSSYWQGDISSRALTEAGAQYGEFLASGLPTPRRAWLAANDDEPDDIIGTIGGIFLTPLHFPLEGGTDDRDLAYFDHLADDFRRRLAVGGHAIIASHPDLSQEILVDLLHREDLSSVWMAPVAAAVRRWQDVMTPGSVRVVMPETPESGYYLSATRDLADLCVETVHPGGKTVIETLQLKPGIRRRISAEAPACDAETESTVEGDA